MSWTNIAVRCLLCFANCQPNWQFVYRPIENFPSAIMQGITNNPWSREGFSSEFQPYVHTHKTRQLVVLAFLFVIRYRRMRMRMQAIRRSNRCNLRMWSDSGQEIGADQAWIESRQRREVLAVDTSTRSTYFQLRSTRSWWNCHA